jgi:hypothetical protein
VAGECLKAAHHLVGVDRAQVDVGGAGLDGCESHGNQSKDGEQFTERSLSASVTCRLQHRSLHHYLTNLFTAHQHGGALPALT